MFNHYIFATQINFLYLVPMFLSFIELLDPYQILTSFWDLQIVDPIIYSLNNINRKNRTKPVATYDSLILYTKYVTEN